MALTSLLVCEDAQAVHVLSRILRDLGIDVEVCSVPNEALPQLRERSYDAILVDCKHEQAAIDLFVDARKTPINRATLAIAIVDAGNNVREVFAKGANFVVYKPVSAERAANSLRAARGLMRRERRRNQRVPLHAEASIAYAGIDDVPATLLDLSEQGIALQSDRKLPPRCKVYFQFNLPGQVSTVRLSGEVAWQDSSGRVGIRFADVPQTSRKILSQWLGAGNGHATAPKTSESTAPLAIQGPTGLGQLSASSSDRRVRSRKACHLSADVYRLGSNVPNRCTLSDISTGGCYVETTSPFPTGTGVDLVVRTSDLKLRVRGTVQAVHPAFGMGVAFTLQTAEQRDQVQQLIGCQPVESATPTDMWTR